MRDPKDWKKPSRYFETLGMRLAASDEDSATVELTFSEAFGNRKGDVHGGVIAGLIDISMSEAIRTTLTDFKGLSTISMSINYLDVARGDLTGIGRVTRKGRTTAFASAEVRDRAGNLVASGQGSFRIIR